MDLQLLDRSILVTGGSSGIGLETARLLLADGAKVTICGRDLDRLREAERELDSVRLGAVQADVYDPDQAGGAVAEAVDHGGGLDGLAAVAGYGHRGSLLELPTAEIVEEVNHKLLALLNVARPAIPALTTSRGRIVGLTAPTAQHPDPAMGAIGVGRAAIENAVTALAVELAPAGIGVNAVSVGLIDTPHQRSRHGQPGSTNSYDDWLAEEATRRGIPLGRAGTAQEVAAAICWLLSPRSAYTTGAILAVTGGH